MIIAILANILALVVTGVAFWIIYLIERSKRPKCPICMSSNLMIMSKGSWGTSWKCNRCGFMFNW